MSRALPVTVVTGFLGAGKTTLVNHLLAARAGERVAVIENEFGPVSVDAALVERPAELVELNDGCVCCSVRGDLVRTLADFAARLDAGTLALDRVLIETSGLAEPAPVIQSFFADPGVHARFRLDAVVGVLDPAHALRQLDEYATARAQAACADVLVLAARDASPPDPALARRLLALNPRARVVGMQRDRIDADAVLDVGAFSLTAAGIPQRHAEAHVHAHDHADDIRAVVFESTRPFDEARLEDFLARFIARRHADLLRYKGVLHLAGEPRMTVWQGVHATVYGDRAGAWPDGVAPHSRLVFIGRHLAEPELTAGLAACLA